MKSKWYWTIYGVILLVALLIRIIPAWPNNFYFTMDQGNDAVHVRDILHRHHLFLLGPETSIFGIFAGPLWYYFIGIGYWLFGGHPFGALFMIIALNVFLIGWVMQRISWEVSPKVGLLIGLMLLTSWWFYDASRYAFNPFPLVIIAFGLIFSLTDLLRGQTRGWYKAAILLGLGFNSELAGTVAMTIFTYLVVLYTRFKNRLTWKQVVLGSFILVLFLLPHVISEVATNFSQTRILLRQFTDADGVFANTQFTYITNRYYRTISRSTLRQVPELGLFLFCLVLVLFFKRVWSHARINKFAHYFVLLTILLLIISWLFFVSNDGWRDWHTVYLSPLIFVSLLLALSELPRYIIIPVLAISLVSHLNTFLRRYHEYAHPGDDPSILANEMQAIDWVYHQAQGQGFYVYAYLPSIFDYPYQYLFWWYGLKQYKYLPCEYSTYPHAPDLAVPGKRYYRQPQRPCTSLRFLIIEPDNINPSRRQEWLDNLRANTAQLSETQIGRIKIQELRLLE